MGHSILLTLTTTLVITIFLGLAVFVVTRNSQRPASWVFSLLCLSIAAIYLSSLFMVVTPDPIPSLTHFFLRLKWVAIAISPTLYLHFVYFYFPSAWQPYRAWILFPTYLIDLGLAGIIFVTDALLIDHIHYAPPHIITPNPGPLFYGIVLLFMIQVAGGAGGLFLTFRLAHSWPFRRQITYLLVPTSLVLLGSSIYWVSMFTKNGNTIPHEISDALLLLAAFLYVQSIIRYGSFVGRPLARRTLLYTILSVAMGLILFYLSLTLDEWLMQYTHYPYPIATGILVLILTVGLPKIRHQVKQRLDGWLFNSEKEQQALVHHLVDALSGSPNLKQLQAELLESLCTVLDVDHGYIALSMPNSAPEQLTVQVVQGNLALKSGDIVTRPALQENEAELVAATLSPSIQMEPPLQQIALICPLNIGQNVEGILALGEKRLGDSFTHDEMALCNNLARQLDTVGQMMRLRERRNRHLEAARLQEGALRRLEEKVVGSARQALTSWQQQSVPLEIRILGSLQVFRHGKLIPEATWGSEKAKGLLAYLLWKSPMGATRAEISEVLWPERPIEETANVFHVTLYRLRKVIQPERDRNQSEGYIQCERKHYFFNKDLPHRLDVTCFQEYLESDNLADWRAAVNLYRGPYLDDQIWTLPSEVEIQKRHLEQMYIDTLRRLAARTTGQESSFYLEKLLAIEPTDEEIHKALVLGYLARGRQDLARQQVIRWQHTLLEFDYEPSAETRAFWEDLNYNDQQNS